MKSSESSVPNDIDNQSLICGFSHGFPHIVLFQQSKMHTRSPQRISLAVEDLADSQGMTPG